MKDFLAVASQNGLLFIVCMAFACLAFACRSFVIRFYFARVREVQRRMLESERFDDVSSRIETISGVISDMSRVPFVVLLCGYVAFFAGIAAVLCLVIAAVGVFL